MIVNLLEFYVRPESEEAFEQLNGPNGLWYELFSSRSEFCGINYLKSMESVLKDEKQARRYLTMDRWKSERAFKLFSLEHQVEFDRLSKMNEGLSIEENYIGFFELVG